MCQDGGWSGGVGSISGHFAIHQHGKKTQPQTFQIFPHILTLFKTFIFQAKMMPLRMINLLEKKTNPTNTQLISMFSMFTASCTSACMKIVVVPSACSDVIVVTSQRIVCYRAVHCSPHLLKMAQVKEVFCFFFGGWGGSSSSK